MRSITIDYNYNGKPTITKDEYLKLKESLKNTFNPNKTSVLNKSLTKGQSFKILFNDDLFIKTNIEYLHFLNIIREFVINKKTFRNWKELDKYKPIKEIKEIRKKKLEKIERR